MLARRQTEGNGFTLLEFEICVVILTLTVLGVTQLVVKHGELVSDLEAWCVGAPQYFVALAEDDLERVLGYSARLSDTLPTPPAPAPSGTLYTVEIQAADQELYPPKVTATVHMVLDE